MLLLELLAADKLRGLLTSVPINFIYSTQAVLVRMPSHINSLHYFIQTCFLELFISFHKK